MIGELMEYDAELCTSVGCLAIIVVSTSVQAWIGIGSRLACPSSLPRRTTTLSSHTTSHVAYAFLPCAVLHIAIHLVGPRRWSAARHTTMELEAVDVSPSQGS